MLVAQLAVRYAAILLIAELSGRIERSDLFHKEFLKVTRYVTLL